MWTVAGLMESLLELWGSDDSWEDDEVKRGLGPWSGSWGNRIKGVVAVHVGGRSLTC